MSLFRNGVCGKNLIIIPASTTNAKNDTITLAAEDPELGLKLDATMVAHDDHIAVRGTVEDTTGEDRAITVYFSLLLDALGWTWFDDARVSLDERPVSPGQDRVLQRHGYQADEISKMNFREASSRIEAIKENGWQRPTSTEQTEAPP